MQFKWRPPDEPGGHAISAYRFQISPPPAVDEELLLEEVVHTFTFLAFCARWLLNTSGGLMALQMAATCLASPDDDIPAEAVSAGLC